LVKLAATVRALSGQLGREPAAPVEPPPRTLAKGHRFQRSAAPDVRHSEPASPGEHLPAEETEPEDDASLADRQHAAAAGGRPAQAHPRPAGKFAALREHPIFVWIVVQAFCFGLLLLGVFVGETESQAPAPQAASATPKDAVSRPTPGAPDATPERTLQTAADALAKESAGDFSGASALLESLGNSQSPPPGTEYQLALLALRLGDQSAADLHIGRSIAANQDLAPCYYLRAAFAGAKGDYREASAQLRLAAQAAPFDGKYLFYLGESLRRTGNLQEAAECIRQALSRPLTARDGELYLFKMRLAHIEVGRGDPLVAELDDRLRGSAPSGDWLLLAAAQNVQRNVFPAAAEFLQRAARALPPATFHEFVQDYAFQNYAREPEIAPFLRPVAAAGAPSSQPNVGASVPAPDAIVLPPGVPAASPVQATAPVVVPPDPATCPPEEADPALWRTMKP
jgi:tetratricopeptide (TPR) repeat protein